MPRLALPLVALLPALVVAAPAPKETEADKIRRLYGAPEDPDKVCTFRLDGNLLRLTAAKGLRGLNPARGLVNAPRTLKPAEGDFVASVRITRDAPAEGTGRADDGYTPSGGGGLLLWVDADTHLRLSRSQWIAEGEGGRAFTTYNLRGVSKKAALRDQQSSLNEPDTQPVTFRLTRTGKTVRADYRPDGKEWTAFQEVELDLPDGVKVGVYAAHNFNKPLEVVFEPLVVQKPPLK